MYLDNKYAKWYYNIIIRAASRQRLPNCQYEKHHIVPESFFKASKRGKYVGWLEGEPEAPNNLVYLTTKEHFTCHLLLARMTTGRARYMMVRAVFLMIHACKKKGIKIIQSSRQYELLRREYQLANSGKNNGNYNSTIYSFIFVETGKIERLTQLDFYTKYNIDYRGVNRLVKGNSKTCQGWSIEGRDTSRKPKVRKPKIRKERKILFGNKHPMHDKMIYTWNNTKLGIQVKLTQYDLIHGYGLNNGNISQVAHGKIPSCKGWKVVND